MGLVFIFLGLSWLGPIKLAFITSSRKVFSVLASILFFRKPVDFLKFAGIFLVISGMIAENFIVGNQKHLPDEKGSKSTELKDEITDKKNSPAKNHTKTGPSHADTEEEAVKRRA